MTCQWVVTYRERFPSSASETPLFFAVLSCVVIKWRYRVFCQLRHVCTEIIIRPLNLRETDKQTGRQADRELYGQTDRQTR